MILSYDWSAKVALVIDLLKIPELFIYSANDKSRGFEMIRSPFTSFSHLMQNVVDGISTPSVEFSEFWQS